MQNPIRVFVAFVRETALVMTEKDSRLIRHTGAVPAECVFVEESVSSEEPVLIVRGMMAAGGVDQIGTGEFRQGMRRRPDSSKWEGGKYTDVKSWKTYRARQHHPLAVA